MPIWINFLCICCKFITWVIIKKQLLVRFSLFAAWESPFSVVIIQLRFCLGKAISLLRVFWLFYPVCFYLYSLYISSFLFGCFTMVVPFLLGLLPPMHSICLIDFDYSLYRWSYFPVSSVDSVLVDVPNLAIFILWSYIIIIVWFEGRDLCWICGSGFV